MRYKYGTSDSYTKFRGKTVNPSELAEIIKEDVGCGKWNKYEGGKANSTTAHCRYERKGFVYHNRLLIYGNKKEFTELEKLIDDFIYVEPRIFK